MFSIADGAFLILGNLTKGAEPDSGAGAFALILHFPERGLPLRPVTLYKAPLSIENWFRMPARTAAAGIGTRTFAGVWTMAVPKRKTSPSRRGMRRSADALKQPTYVEDKDSGELRRPHHLDLKTGMYRGRQILKPKVEA